MAPPVSYDGEEDDIAVRNESSDVEAVFEIPNPYAHAGQQNRAKILQSREELRSSTKIGSKSLGQHYGAPGTVERDARVKTAWETFYVDSLKKSSKTMPTGDDVVRFLLCTADITESKAPRKAIAWNTLSTTLTSTVHAIRLRHDTFRLTYNEKHRIKCTFGTLQEQGKITKTPAYAKQWITSTIVCQLTRALLVDAIRHNPPLNWSIVIHQCLGLALQSALCCRAGDAARSRMYDKTTCLQYGHIMLKVSQLDNLPPTQQSLPLLERVKLEAIITLSYTKGHKKDGSKNVTHALASLEGPEHNVIDSLKLLLCHAVRQGAVADATTINDCIVNALARRDGKVQWTFPKRPVLCAYDQGSQSKFDFDKGAAVKQLRTTLVKAAALSGISERLTTHDIRRGAARDVSMVGSKVSKNMQAAAASIGHSTEALHGGLTAQYVGHDPVPNFQARLTLPSTVLFPLRPVDPNIPAPLGQTSGKRQRNSTKAELDEYITNNSHLFENIKTTKTRRSKAGGILTQARRVAASTTHVEVDNLPAVPTKRRRADIEGTYRDAPQADDGDKEALQDNEDSNIDPVLLSLTGITSSTSIADEARFEADVTDMQLDIALDSTDTAEDTDTTDIDVLGASPGKFMAWLSTINVTRENKNARKEKRVESVSHLRGHGRDEPTLFIFPCKNKMFGCIFNSTDDVRVVVHELDCTPEKLAAAAEPTYDMTCDDCGMVCSGKTWSIVRGILKTHKETHINLELSCSIGGHPSCDRPIRTERLLKKHIKDIHADDMKILCPFQPCHRTDTIRDFVRLERHLRNTHKLDKAAREKLVVDAKASVSERGN